MTEPRGGGVAFSLTAKEWEAMDEHLAHINRDYKKGDPDYTTRNALLKAAFRAYLKLDERMPYE